jgi:hypothetical protein
MFLKGILFQKKAIFIGGGWEFSLTGAAVSGWLAGVPATLSIWENGCEWG